ncbi:hypothetical protein NIES4071_104220 (plasmid) [Calothrix sp. NIES-4071]|nr:hypothetical protein NIES4071_104220 [Calothrix sp. NIES-4071]BAZ64409.1 hypothetical protein NIES4105_101420 [Calothrix sp. NIES-4105]
MVEKKVITTIDITDVAYVKWRPEMIAAIKGKMEEQGYRSVRTLAQNIGTSHENLYKYMNGKYHMISVELLNSLCSSLSISMDTLIKIHEISVYDG